MRQHRSRSTFHLTLAIMFALMLVGLSSSTAFSQTDDRYGQFLDDQGFGYREKCGQFWPSTGMFQTSSDGYEYGAVLHFKLTQAEKDALMCVDDYLELDFRILGFTTPAEWDDYSVSTNIPGGIHDTAATDDSNQATPGVTGIKVSDLAVGYEYYAGINFFGLSPSGEGVPRVSFEWQVSHWASSVNETAFCKTIGILGDPMCIFGTTRVYLSHGYTEQEYGERQSLVFDGYRFWEFPGTAALQPSSEVNALQPAITAPPACNDSGIPQITNGLAVSPESPDTETQVNLSFTITNIGCGIFQPEVLAIGGRDPQSNVSDPLQVRDFTLGPGESRDINQATTLKMPGTHEFFMVFLRTNGGWNEIPDSSGVSRHIYVNVVEAAESPADPPAEATETETAPPSESIETPAPSDTTDITPITSQESDLAPMDIGATNLDGHEIGAQFTVTTEDGVFLGTCTLEGDPQAPYPLSCRVPVPRYTTVIVTLDTATITPGYVPVENPIIFDTSSEPGAASHWGVSFRLEPQEVQQIEDVKSGDNGSRSDDSSETTIGSTTESGVINIALITRDPKDGHLLTDVCYELVGYSNQGCDENGDGQVTFDAIPYGTYTVSQTKTPAGYSTINNYDIHVQPPGYLEGVTEVSSLSFIVKQAAEQNARDSRNVSVVFIDMMTHERVTTGVCVELVGASNIGCDEDLIDGQVDFLDVPSGGPYELDVSNLPAGRQVAEVGGPLAVIIKAAPSDPAHAMVFVLLADSGGGGGATIEPGNSTTSDVLPSSGKASNSAQYTVIMTFRGCPEGFVPDVGDPFADCTIPLDAPDLALVGEWGVGESLIPITSLERQYDGEYVFYPSSDHGYYLHLTGLEPVLRDDFLIYGVDDQDGSSYVTLLVEGKAHEIFVFYYYR